VFLVRFPETAFDRLLAVDTSIACQQNLKSRKIAMVVLPGSAATAENRLPFRTCSKGQ
jgi:hypothetical protein